jgi:hypothetical protein
VIGVAGDAGAVRRRYRQGLRPCRRCRWCLF